jgi:hypothetical protein
MSERRPALIVYDGLPVSSGGAHGLGKRGPVDVWTQLSRFLHQCADLIGSYETALLVYEAAGKPLTPIESGKTSATTLFGMPQRRVAVTGVVEILENSWGLGADQLPQALTWLTEQHLVPSLSTGPAFVVGLQARFRLKDPDSGEVLPFQGPEHYGHQTLGHQLPLGVSMLYARLAARSTCSLTLCLPFTDVSPELMRCVVALQHRLPFKLSEKHWARWQLNAAGSAYYSRKIRMML